jgi:hypothetical protein
MPICAQCSTDNPDIAKFCLACGAPVTTAEKHEEERKPVTAVFVDLVGSTSRAEGLDPEEVLRRFRPARGGALDVGGPQAAIGCGERLNGLTLAGRPPEQASVGGVWIGPRTTAGPFLPCFGKLDPAENRLTTDVPRPGPVPPAVAAGRRAHLERRLSSRSA